MFISPAYAQTADGGTTAVIMQLLPLILIFAVFYFLLIRPQQKKMKEHRALLGQLKRNDKVITAGGIVGTISKVRDDSDEIEVEIAPGVRVTVVRGTIASVVKPPEPANDTKA
ncbi:preprotein translocase subunit YajC [Falsiroseomonas stagni]|uniref:Sec translocon accessory complex subunit YajC n=1 Tax=Falsiroseomonas stagni DSM 19981 TaxID=1123062 RepID=A0A1I4ARW3_9PROT|nr:preprotein translocase subunit YajC [Falsiroseomonas stagni]SFK58697.1 preprotein translocase subunit YajC [Falsiroseomonas stagni DSM 19981]